MMSTTSPRHVLLLAGTSISVLAYEILLMRLLSIGQWHHFAYMAISLALLGFGAAGSMLFILYNRIREQVDAVLPILSGLTSISFPLTFLLSQEVGLDPLQLIWQPTQWFKMLLTYLLMSIPFLLAGGIVGITLTGAGEKTHRMYAVDLFGAGVGALCIIPALFACPPWKLLPLLSCVLLFCSIGFCFPFKKSRIPIFILSATGIVLLLTYIMIPPLPKIHESKGLPMTLSIPDAEIELTRSGPLGWIQVVGSSQIRYVPGLSLKFGLNGEKEAAFIPEQKAIFVDADGLSPITSYKGNPRELEYLDFTSMALPFHMGRKMEKMLSVGVGGGMDILMGILHRVSNITALEANRQIADLLIHPFADFSGSLYSRDDVRLEICEARQFLQSTRNRYDIIQVSMTDSFVNSAGGLHSATENYLYTREACAQYLAHLTDSGILAISRWLKLPPRDSLRIISTILSVLKNDPAFHHPGEHLFFIRSWKTFTILLSKSPFSLQEIRRAGEFCEKRNFDIAYYAGMKPVEANRYDIQERPYHFMGASALCGPDADSFLKNYLFDVSPTTDNRPFFLYFFKWKKGLDLIHFYGRELFNFAEMGHIFVIGTLAQASVAGVLLILLPLFLYRHFNRSSVTGRMPLKVFEMMGIIAYFGLIGSGFMFIEMAFLPLFTLVLSSPVYAASVVLASILVFAGLGSLSVKGIEVYTKKVLWISLTVISCWFLLYALLGDQLFKMVLGLPFPHRLFFSVLFISIPSFFLGRPFPVGLRFIGRKWSEMVPWAWGINGCASVTGAVLGKLIAVSFGFRLLLFTSCVLYLFAVMIFHFGFGSLRNRDVLQKSST